MSVTASRLTLDSTTHFPLRIGHLSRPEIVRLLERSGVHLNESAEVLLESKFFDALHDQTLCLVTRRVGQIPLVGDRSLSNILEGARLSGVELCPVTTGPYLRLALRDQPDAPDSILSNGSAPSGSMTVGSLRPGPGLPTGFYLRMIAGVPWLRGYHATDEHHWRPEDLLVFSTPCTSTSHRDIALEEAALGPLNT